MGNIKLLQPIIITALKCIQHPKGDVYLALKHNEGCYAGFGEAYFTTIIKGEIKGWKKHSTMTMNLIVPEGMVRFHVHDEEKISAVPYDIGKNNYCRLTIPPGYWVAFEGLESGVNLVLNIASEEHNPNEAENLPLETFILA